MPVKVTLEDGRVFEVGQNVEWMTEKKEWISAIVGTSSLGLYISIACIAMHPERVRAIAPKVKRPMTAKEVWSLIVSGVRWRYKDWNVGVFAMGGFIFSINGVLYIEANGARYLLSECAYSIDQPWQKFEVEE